ncbi:MAG TPA: ELWxxDGT repeat protein [Steroidobacteraceae bacterium]|nr:ELWxxDGT repeat protein [Steroidobacteraceae bacterium]
MFKLSMAVAAGMLATCALVAPQPAHARLVRDINATSTSGNGSVNAHIEIGNLVLFSLDDGIHGLELWSTDGTPAGTRLLRDINPGPASSNLNQLTALNGAAYFWADDGTNGMELWRSDGTTSGTTIVADIGPGTAGTGGIITNGVPITTFEGVLYFMADDLQSGQELWRSDGTRAGTYLLADILPGPDSSSPADFRIAGSHMFFAANDGVHGRELWRTDGTASGTRLVADIRPGSFDGVGGLFNVAVVGDALYFGADDGTSAGEPWRATADGATRLADLNTIPEPLVADRNGSSNPRNWMPAGNSALFIATAATPTTPFVDRIYRATGTTITPVVDLPPFTNLFPLAHLANATLFRFGQGGAEGEIWVSDGTAAGTAPLRPGGSALFPSLTSLALVQTDTEAFFYASRGPGQPETLWRTDGTSVGTREYFVLPEPIIGGEVVLLNGLLYFHAGRFSDPEGDELWVSDGTPGGTHRVSDIAPGSGDAGINNMFAAHGKVFFQANDGVSGAELWVSDGTGPGTMALGDLNAVLASASSEPDILLPFGNGILLTANDGISGGELWFSDGTTNGTHLVADIAPGFDGSRVTGLVAMQDFVLFAAQDGASGLELWRTDGTEMGTQRVLDINPGPASGADNMTFGSVVMDGVAYFAGDDGTTGNELWRSDGTAAGTFLVADVTPGLGGPPLLWGVVGQRVVFRAQNRIWASDGTEAGTEQLRSDIEVTSTLQSEVAVLNGFLYFAARDEATGDGELWRTDGTPAGTQPVTDLAPNDSLFVSDIHAVGNTLFMHGCTVVQPTFCGLYASDGTNAGTHRVLETPLGSGGVNDGTRLFFLDTRTLPERIFVSDGTAAGTHPFLPAGANVVGSIGQMTWFQGALIFTVHNPERGPVVWRSDGTAVGTHLIFDLDAGNDTSRTVGEYTPLGSRLFFTGYSSDTGNELYILDDDRPFANADTVHTDFNVSTRIDVLDNDAPFSGSLDRSSVELTGLPQAGSATVDAVTGEIVYVPNTGFSGTDTLQYRVRDDQGRLSDSAMVFVVVGAVQGEDPGTSPTPPTPPPPPNNPGNSGGGGGGGSFDWLLLIALAGVGVARRRRTRH